MGEAVEVNAELRVAKSRVGVSMHEWVTLLQAEYSKSICLGSGDDWTNADHVDQDKQ